MNKKKIQSNITQKLILEKAKELFIQKGYAATSVEEISAATGHSKGNIFYHFKSKEGLFLKMLEDWDKEWDEQWNLKKGQFTSSADQLYEFVEHMVINEINHPFITVADEFFTAEKTNSEVTKLLDQMLEQRLELIQQLLIDGIHSGEFEISDTLLAAKVLDSLFNGIGLMCKNLSIDQTLLLYKTSIDIFLNGISKKVNT
ncbi:TetR/AcrR family transcriptional regulator [Paenibacillus jamilae]|uniref:TetR/AcrR family transcriptional regulator n=1 Tax=Paenibacillus jamilae TaxID=114136 RepID=UPI003D2BC897